MSDERLREAERKWKETGSVDDEARYLLERVRVGDLTQERLELAAYCGHEGAVAATPAGVSLVADLKTLITVREDGPVPATRLIRFSTEFVVSLAHVACAAALREVSSENVVTSAMSAVEKWLQCPCNTHASQCGRVSQELVAAMTHRSREDQVARSQAATASLLFLVHSAARKKGSRESAARAIGLIARAHGGDYVASAIRDAAGSWVHGR